MAKNVMVDARGDQCPIPVVKAKKALEELQGPGIVQIYVDNAIAVQNLEKMAVQKGLEFSQEKIDERCYLAAIKTEKGLIPDGEVPSCTLNTEENFVAAIDSAVMGRGNDELGKVLMKGFIYALSQLDKLPKTVLFYNGGATLTTEGSDSLEDIKSMEEQGVVIKTCGTCLNYYNLSDKLQVGEVTNMYDIVETLAAATKIVKP